VYLVEEMVKQRLRALALSYMEHNMVTVATEGFCFRIALRHHDIA
jgi:hypothetical protein